MIDADGFRTNIGIILSNNNNKVFLAKRFKQNAGQFPQGGVDPVETLEHALFRELKEEIGLSKNSVKILGSTKYWLRYRIPKKLIRETDPNFIGQKQKWYLLEFLGE